MNFNDDKFSKIINHLIITGFVYQNSLIYGGLANTWDYGPLGIEVKNNLKQYWWKKFVQESENNVGIDTAIFMNKKVWEASGHTKAFNDPLIDCKNCKSRYRADEFIKKQYDVDTNKMSFEDMNNFIKNHDFKCKKCNEKNNFTNVRQFNMMFKTSFGLTENNHDIIYLRPETAQGIFINFKNVQRSSRKKIPFGICNIGKSFRNEITLGNFIFRTKEFEQLEMEFFCKPGTDSKWFDFWKNKCFDFIKSLDIKTENIRYREHQKEELAFYSKNTVDIEYYFPTIGWGEILGIANRSDYDLKCHMNFSKESLEYFDDENKKKYIPYCIEPSIGLDRLLLMVLVDSYHEEKIDNNDTRIVMHLKPLLAPYKVIILPLIKKLNVKAKEIFNLLNKFFMCLYDENGSIGKRYRRADAIGIPFAITIDFETFKNDTVTIRDRDSMKQIKMKIPDIHNYLFKKINNF